MRTVIHRIPLGKCSCYLIQEEGLVLVDTGDPNKGKKFSGELNRFSIDPKSISLIVLTHGHHDHIGSVHELKELTGAKLAINYREKEWVEKPLKPVTPGIGLYGKILEGIWKISDFSVHFQGTPVDIALDDSEFSLKAFGISSTLIHTLGHTLGSTSLFLDSGEAFVGDLTMNALPFVVGVSLPVFAADMERVKKSIRLLQERGARTFYPGHGKPFSADTIYKQL
jgi:hydroxyacylglutathione hydrolase